MGALFKRCFLNKSITKRNKLFQSHHKRKPNSVNQSLSFYYNKYHDNKKPIVLKNYVYLYENKDNDYYYCCELHRIDCFEFNTFLFVIIRNIASKNKIFKKKCVSSETKVNFLFDIKRVPNYHNLLFFLFSENWSLQY